MIYSQSTIYALEALRYLSSLPKGEVVKTRDMASKLNIPNFFLAKVLLTLVKHRFIVSIRGPRGGVKLAVDPNKITLYDIFNAMGGMIDLNNKCIIGLKNCSDNTPCPFHSEWLRFKNEMIRKSKKITLAGISGRIDNSFSL